MKKNWNFVVLFVCGFLFSANLVAQDFGPNNSIVLQRNVVSFMLGDTEYKDMIDRVELNWVKAVENWVPENLLTYVDENHNRYDMRDYIQEQLSKRNYYHLTITFFYKDGTSGFLTLYGGATGDSESLLGDSQFGESMHWFYHYPGAFGGIGSSSYYADGSLYETENLFWNYIGGKINLGWGADIVTGDEWPNTWSYWAKEGDRRKNTILFYTFETRDVLLELDGSFFP